MMKKSIAIMIIASLMGCGERPSAPAPESTNTGQQSDLSKEKWSVTGPKLAELARLALCPTQATNAFTIEYVDRAPFVEVGLARSGNRIVFSKEVIRDLTDPDPSPRRAPPMVRIREYIEIVVFPITEQVPADARDTIPWSGFTSFYHVQPVDMGTGFGFRWFGRMHLWEQDDLRERLRLLDGEDRHALAVAGGSVKDDGHMTANSMACRMDRFKQKIGSNHAQEAIGAEAAPQLQR